MLKETAREGKVVVIHYTLTSEDGEVLDTSDGGEPLAFLHGAGNIVPGLERAIEGRAVGDGLNVSVPPTEGYGDRTGPGPQPVPREAFPDGVALRAGMMLAAEGPDGQQMPLWVAAVEDERVFIDSNHPLAGQTLHFQVEIVRIRDATAEERAHGHPHGPDGTAHHH